MLAIYFTPYMLPLFGIVLVTLSIVIYSWQRREVKGASTLAFLMLVTTIHAFNYALELGSSNFATAYFFLRFEYIGISLLGVSFLLHILDYSNQLKSIPSWQQALLFVIPLLTNLFVWTNDAHKLIWQSVTLDYVRGYTVWQSEFGSWFWVHLAYSYFALLLSFIILGRAIARSPHLYRRQMFALGVGALAPWVGNVILFTVSPPIDPTPFMFGISGVAMAWAIFRGNYLAIMPIAREAVLSQLSDGVLVLDPQDTIVDMNPAAELIFAVSSQKTIGQPLTSILPQIKTEFELPHANQSRVYQLKETILSNKQGKHTGRVLTLHDITDRKKNERLLREARDVAQQADRAKSTFLANMSHELRTPLAVILGYTELIEEILEEDGLASPMVFDKLEKVQTSGQHLLSLISDVLDISKIEAGRVELEIMPLDLAPFLQTIVDMVQPLMANNNNQLITQFDALSIKTDVTKLRQILMNLLSNAAKFTHDGSVRFEVTSEPECVQFRIIDTGIGINKAKQVQLFQPFIQADTSTTRQYGGTGLGLAISHRLAHLLGGDIQLTSEVGLGSTFTLTLPLGAEGIVDAFS